MRTAAEIAERIGDKAYELRALWGLCDYHTWSGEHRAALNLAYRIREAAIAARDWTAQVNVGRQLGTALRYLGELAEARNELEQMIRDYAETGHWSHSARFQLDPRIAARGTLANVLWLQGFADQSISLSRLALEDAKATNHALALCNAYAHTAIPIALYVGDWVSAERWLTEFLEHTTEHLMPVWGAVGRCLQGILMTQYGKPEGPMLLRYALDDLARFGFRMRYPAYLGSLASALGHSGKLSEAKATINEALNWSNEHEERWCVGELLRIKGELLCAEAKISGMNDADICFQQSIQWSQRHGALSFELRAAASLAQLWRMRERNDNADQLLSATYARFIERVNPADLRPAREALRQSPSVVA